MSRRPTGRSSASAEWPIGTFRYAADARIRHSEDITSAERPFESFRTRPNDLETFHKFSTGKSTSFPQADHDIGRTAEIPNPPSVSIGMFRK